MTINEMLDTYKLPDGIHFYAVANRRIFEIRSDRSTPIGRSILYLYTTSGGKHYKYGIEFPSNSNADHIKHEIDASVPIFVLELINVGAREFDPDGGDLGAGDNV